MQDVACKGVERREACGVERRGAAELGRAAGLGWSRMKSPLDRPFLKALGRGAVGRGGPGALLESALVGWRAAQAMKGAPRSGRRGGTKAKGARRKPASKPHTTPRVRGGAPRSGRLEAVGWFLAAGVILAWPRRESPFDWGFLKRQLGRPAPPHAEAIAADVAEPGRGRSARHPGEIPLRGWRDIFWRAWTEFNRDNIPQVAGGVTFFGLLALFPAMAAFVSLYGLFFDPSTASQQVRLLAGVLPQEALGFVNDQLTRLTSSAHSGLSIGFVTGLLLSLWSANAGMKALMVGLNIAFEEKEKRNFLKLNLVSLCFTLGGLVFVMLSGGAVIVAPIVLGFIGYQGSGLALLRWPVLLLVAVGALAVLYRYGPSRERERWTWVSAGSAFAAVLWLVTSLLFSQYVAHFGHYDKTYGSLGAVIGFMSWIWISVITVLFGAEINSEIEHQTAVDTTTGHARPMGERGAFMADTLGKARPAAKSKAKAEAQAPTSPKAAMSGA
jgi:membrane protein